MPDTLEPDTLEKVPPAPTPKADEGTSFKLAVFGAVLVVTLFAGYGLGRLNNVGSTGTASTPPAAVPTGGMAGMPGVTAGESEPHTHNANGTVTQGGTTMSGMGSGVGGLSLSSDGLTLVPTTTTWVAGKRQPFRFRITGPGGAPITTYAVVHDKPLHLIVIRRDLSGYQHLHPTMAPDGTWSIDLTLAEPGSYRAVADLTAVVGGRPAATTLGTDLLMTVTGPDGRPAALEPYLGAFGHLVMFRQGDLGYVHIHPELHLVDGKVKFWLAAPGPGHYRMFFDFQVAHQVHTAAWTMTVD